MHFSFLPDDHENEMRFSRYTGEGRPCEFDWRRFEKVTFSHFRAAFQFSRTSVTLGTYSFPPPLPIRGDLGWGERDLPWHPVFEGSSDLDVLAATCFSYDVTR